MSHPDFYYALTRIHEDGAMIELMTSGLRIHSLSIAQKLYDHGVRKICIPLYAAKARIHDSIVGVAGHFQKVQKGIAFAREMGITVSVHTLLLRRTVLNLSHLATWVQEQGLEPLVIAPLRPKESLFSYKKEGVPFALFEVVPFAFVD